MVQLSVAVMPQDGHFDPHGTIEVSRPKQAHTWHFTVLWNVSFSISFTNFLGKILLPIVLLGDPRGVELRELAAITASHW